MSQADDRVGFYKPLAYASSLVKALSDGCGTHEQRAKWARKAAQYLQTYARHEEAKHILQEIRHQEEHKQP